MSRAGDDRRRALHAARIYLIVTPSAVRGDWERAVESALAPGLVGLLQLREKDADDRRLLAVAARLRALAARHGVPWILNDRPDLVATTEADGVHVGEDDPPPRMARALVGPDRLVGVSTHDEAEVRAAVESAADHAGLGPCFPSGTKRLERAPGGADLVRRCARWAGDLPLFPVGGIGPENAAELVRAGATRLAVGASVLDAEDPGAQVRALDRILRETRPG